MLLSGCRDAGSSPNPDRNQPAASAAASGSAASGTAGSSAAAASATAKPAGSASADNKTRAQALAKRFIIVDGHVDLPYRLYRGRDKDGSSSEDVTKRTEKGDFDWVRARAGGLDAPFMSIYVPAKHQKTGDAKEVADTLIDMVEALAKASPDKFALAHNPEQVRANFAAGKVSLPMGIENGAAIEGKLEHLAHFHKRGVRYITLTHSKDNDICDSSYDESHTHKGLSAFGRDVVKEMNRLGIMVDVSHISDDAFEQVMELSSVPVIASHSSCRHFTPDFERNMSDAMIKKLASKGGVIMINYGSTFIDNEVRAQRGEVRKVREAFMKKEKLQWDHPRVRALDKAEVAKLKKPFSTVERVAEHIDHAVKLVGIDYVGLGSDFDGVGDSLPAGLKDPSQLPNLIEQLLNKGYSEADIDKITSGNVMRVWNAVEKHAKSQQAQ